jgi:hypothetical protein
VAVPALTIRIKKHPDASASISCTRRDGSVTWQRQRGALGLVFPPHDLTHYAVETTLGFGRGFYGLLAEGWDISDFAAPWPRGPIPAEAQEVELLVGFFQQDVRTQPAWTPEEFAQHAESFVAARAALKHKAIAIPRVLTPNDLVRVRAVRDALLARWSALAASDELVLEFNGE